MKFKYLWGKYGALFLIMFFFSDIAQTRDLYSTNYYGVTNGEMRNAFADENSVCEFGDEFFKFCGNLLYTEESAGFLSDLEGIGVVDDASSIKLSVLRYNMFLSDSIIIPLSFLVGEVAGDISDIDTNQIKLMDLDQGNANLKFSYLGRYHVGRFCDYSTGEMEGKGGCVAGFDFGVKYIDAAGADTDSVFGAYVGFTNSFLFPILETSSGKDAGMLSLKTSAYYFGTSDDDAGVFSDVTDLNGEIIKGKKSYFIYNIALKFDLTDRLSLKATYLNSPSSVLDSQTVFSFNYSFLNKGSQP